MNNSYQQLLLQQKAYFSTGATKNINFRIEKLNRLKEWIKSNDARIMDALKHDLGKGAFEAYSTEIMGVLGEIDLAIKMVRSWAKPQRVTTPLVLFKARSEIIYEPLGTVLVISPWNYPFGLSVTTVAGVIAAGNCCVLKPSEISRHTSALLTEMVQACFAEEYCCTVEGGAQETTELLKEHFDCIHFTGSTQVGKIVAIAAAKNLTPTILELGGKSPCIVDETADIESTARKICWGKFMNAGQTCVAPDFVLVHSSVKDQLVKALQRQISIFYGDTPQQSEDYGRIINEAHFDRLNDLLKEGTIVCGGQTDKEQLYIAPTVIDDISWESPLMHSEIFGPILPVLVYDELPQAIAILAQREKPLALYLFSQNKAVQQKVIHEISFGGGCINATIMHLVNPNLPFGGVGPSGMGKYHGKWSFESFSHAKSILHKSLLFDLRFLYPPYTNKLRWIKGKA